MGRRDSWLAAPASLAMSIGFLLESIDTAPAPVEADFLTNLPPPVVNGAMHSIKTSMTIRPEKRASRH
jgi:hypothetical protein